MEWSLPGTAALALSLELRPQPWRALGTGPGSVQCSPGASWEGGGRRSGFLSMQLVHPPSCILLGPQGPLRNHLTECLA